MRLHLPALSHQKRKIQDRVTEYAGRVSYGLAIMAYLHDPSATLIIKSRPVQSRL